MKNSRNVILVIAIGLGCAAWWGIDACTSQPCVADDELGVLMEGCRIAASQVKSGRGEITAVARSARPNGGHFEINRELTTAFSGSRCRFSTRDLYVRNDPVPGGLAEEHLFVPGTTIDTVYALDSERAMRYLPGEHEAWIDGRDTATEDIGVYAYETYVVPQFYGFVDIVGIDAIAPYPTEATKTGPRIVGHESIESSECTIVEILWIRKSLLEPGEDITDTWWFWVDPQRGYAVPRLRKWRQGGTRFAEKTLIFEANCSLRRYENDTWWLAQTVADSWIDNGTGEPKEHIAVTYDQAFEINIPVGAEELKLTLPSGTVVKDAILDAKYTVP